MALIVVLVLLTIAIAAVWTFGDAGTPRRFLRRIRFRSPRWIRLRFPRRHRHAVVPTATWTELTSSSSPPTAEREATSSSAQDAESVLVAMLLAGRLSRRDYQRQMAQLAAEDSARGARP